MSTTVEVGALTLMGGRELFCQHRIHNSLDVRRVWASGARVNFGLAYAVISCMTGLQYVESTPHISL
jgi:hypothetical protein